MKALGVILFAVAMGQLAVGSKALAHQPAPPDPYNAPPPTYGTPPPGYLPPVHPTPSTFMMYEAQRKNGGLAILLELFVPGLGSLYGDHAVGTLITWALMLAGTGMLIYGATQWVERDSGRLGESRSNNAGVFGLTTGIVLVLGGRVYGFIDSYMATEEYNRKLKVRMGLPVAVNFGLGPIGSGQAVSFGPRMSFTF
jgi:hypothetical protein